MVLPLDPLTRLQPNGQTFMATTRHSTQLQLPLVHTENLRKSFSFQGPLLWNSLPAYFHSINNLNEFNIVLKTIPSQYKQPQ